MHGPNDQPIETLRISDRDRAKLLDSVEAASIRPVQEDRRRLRVSYPQARAVLTLMGETGNSTRFVVVPRNLSRLGVAFVHGRFIFPNSRCEVLLRSLDDKWHTVEGRVASCRHVQGMVHEIAVVFDKAIDLPQFVTLSPEQEMLHLEDVTRDLPPEEAAKVQRMAGRVLVVDTFPIDRKLFSLWLSRSGFKTESVSNTIDALKLTAKERFDLVLVEVHLGNESGIDLINDLANGSLEIPLIAMSADDRPATREAALQAGADYFLPKPFTEADLVQQCHALLGVDTDEPSEMRPIYSASTDDEELKPLLAEFIRGLNGYITQLRDANARKDRNALKTMARSLKGAGSGFGLNPITDAAIAVIKQIEEGENDNVDQLRHDVNELVHVLHRVRL